MTGIQFAGPLPVSHREALLASVILVLGTLDDFLLGWWITQINEYVVADYAKKALIIAICLSTVRGRAIVRRASATPDLPGLGSGWLNAHVLVLIFLVFLCDQGLHHIGLILTNLLDVSAVADVPDYRDEIVKYVDLSFGLMLNSISEEMFYRAVLIAVLYRYIPSLGVCIIVAGLLFGAVHWSQGPVWTGVIALSGMMYGGLFCLTRSIVPGILIHYVHNLIVFTP